MALFMKQDFCPPILSRKWIAIKFRPNMLLYSREHIISILESGLLFREDSVEVEQEAPAPEQVWRAAGGSRAGFTRGEAAAAAAGLAACVLAFPPKGVTRSALVNIAAYICVPLAVRATRRARRGGALPELLDVMRDYLALARRTAACLKEYAALHAQTGSVSSVIESARALLCRQQGALALAASRASAALLGNAPWLRADIAWDVLGQDTRDGDNLMKIHHAFLVVQSTLLKHVAMAHYVQPVHAQRMYKNHNERLYWLHTEILPLLTEEYKQNYEALERMYRLLKNSTISVDSVKKLGTAFSDSWIYSDVHTGVIKTCLELKITLNKCNSLDVFLDSCALNKQEIDLGVLNRDIDDVIDSLTKCLGTVQNSQLRLKKIQNKNHRQTDVDEEVEVVEVNAGILKIEDKDPESKDEVFYCMKTEDDDTNIPTADDLTTAPGKKERDNTKIVLSELRRKLGKREDVMRERERQALAKTMPDLKDVPDFPRQINYEEYVERKGYINKLKRKSAEKCKYNINFKKNKRKNNIFTMNTARYCNESDIKGDVYEANAKLNFKSKLLTISKDKNYVITKWCKCERAEANDPESSNLSESLSRSDSVEACTVNKTINNDGIRFTKKDLELSLSSSESDTDCCKEKHLALLKDARRNRVVRKKNHPVHRRAADNVDESLKPIEYSFGTGMAMASVLQVSQRFPNMAEEEVFVGDGEVSTDSGNDEDA